MTVMVVLTLNPFALAVTVKTPGEAAVNTADAVIVAPEPGDTEYVTGTVCKL
jgi:hypothetical protein